MTYDATLRKRSGGSRRFVSRALLVASVVGITLLGNLRLQASEVRRPVASVAPQSDSPRVLARALALADQADGRAYQTRETLAAKTSVDAPADTTGNDASDDAAGLVPAIYAWDPDVRFVYYRHVSKWM
jgi:hypothetical protein